MKNKIVLVVILITIIIITVGCGKKVVIEQCKETTKDYFTYYNDEQYDDLMLYIDDELETYFGEVSSLKNRLIARRRLLGKCLRYEIVKISYKKEKKEYIVAINYKATYEKQENIAETLTFKTTDWVPVIAGLELGRECIVDEVSEKFFDSYHSGNFDGMIKQFNDIYFEYTSPDTLKEIIASVEKAAGNIKGYQRINEYYYCNIIEDEVACVYTGVFRAEYDYANIIIEIELSQQNDKIGINYLNFKPDSE